MNTEFGKIAHLTQTIVDAPSPLQRELDRVTKVVTAMAVSIGIVFFILFVFLAGVNVAVGFIFAMGMIVAHGNTIAGHGRTTHGKTQCHHQETISGRDFGLHDRHLYRKGRHPCGK